MPLAALTYAGRGYNDAQAAGAGTALSSDLASTFFVPVVVIAAFAFLLRRGMRWFLPVLLVQSALLAAAGERTPVIMAAVALCLLLARCGYRIPRRKLPAAGMLTVVAVLAIMGERAVQGREVFYSGTGLPVRARALVSGLSDPSGTAGGGSGPGFAAQIAWRMDVTAFPAGILQAEHMGYQRLPWTYVPGSLLLDVPSAVMPSKLSRSGDMSPQLLEISDFGLQQVNFLPPLTGLYAGFLPPWAGIALMALLGILAGWGERWVLRRVTPARLVLLAGSGCAVLAFDAGLPSMLLYVRAALVIACAAWLAGKLLRSGAPDVDVAEAGDRGHCRRGELTRDGRVLEQPVRGSRR